MQVALKKDKKSQSQCISSRQVLIPKNKGLEVAPALIEIEDGKIKRVVKLNSKNYDRTVNAIPNIERLDNFLLTPAFVNAHTHLAMCFFRGVTFANAKNIVEDIFFKLESKITAADVRAFARMGAYENLQNGVGCVWDHYYFGESVAEALIDVGLCGVVASTLQDLQGPGKKRWAKTLVETESIHTKTRFRQHGVFAALGPHATDTVSPKLWAEILTSANRNKLPIHGHLAQSTDEVRRSLKTYGLSPTAFLADIGVLDYKHNIWAHGIYTTNDDLKRLAKSEQTLVFCPYSQIIFQHPASIFRWSKAKINWVLGTDCVASNDSMNLQKELRFVAGLANASIAFDKSTCAMADGLSRSLIEKVEKLQKKAGEWSDAFADGTKLLNKVFGGTAAVHPSARFGVLETGAWANIVAWDTNQPCFWPGSFPLRTLAFGDTTTAIANMMVAGNWKAKQFGNYQQEICGSLEYKNARLEAEKRLKALLNCKLTF